MEDNEFITMRIHWEEQRRPIKINIYDDLNAIEKNISNTYQLQQVNNLYKYQIQFYDSNCKTYMDLYPATFDQFQQLLYKLLSPGAPPQSTKEWILKIVSKTVETIRHRIHEAITDDTYNYQQENDPTEIPQNEEILPIINNIQSSLPSSTSRNDYARTLSRDPISQPNNEDQQETGRSGDQSPRFGAINSQLVITADHPYGLHFISNLAGNQRQQYESEMIRQTPLKKSIGGVLLRACDKLDAAVSNTKSYPTVQFKIPNDQHNLAWFLHLCILTEADINGIHYLHASKGIYNHNTESESQFGIIPHSQSMNPYVVRLSKDNLRNGLYEIYIKVCNIRHLPDHNHKQLRDFSRLNSSKVYDDKTFLSEKTTRDLKFSSAKYHLGCILFRDEKAYDRCISNLTTAVSKRARNDNDQSRQQESESEKKKNK